MCACVSTPKLLITSGMKRSPYNWLNKFYRFYMAAKIGIISKRGLRIIRYYINQPNRSKLVLYNLLLLLTIL